jgi:hypothetical protein
MIEANPLKFYVARYFFLGMCLLQWLVSATILYTYPSTMKNQYAALLFFTMGALLFVLFLFIKEKVQRVAVGKKKLVVISSGRKQKIEWDDVKSLKLVPFFNMYRLKLKGRKKSIYFFPSKNINPAYGLLGGDTSKMGEILKKLNAN